MKVRYLLLTIFISSVQFVIIEFNNNSVDETIQTPFPRIQQDQIQVFIDSRFIKANEEVILTIQINNIFEQNNTFNYSVSGPNLHFIDQNGIKYNELIQENITLISHQTTNISLVLLYESNETHVISSVQAYKVEIFDITRDINVYSTEDWVWIYNDYNKMSKPIITEIPIPLYFSETAFLYHSFHFNDTADNGFIEFYMKSIADETHAYQINISNRSQYLQFDTMYYNGFQCSLICGERNIYNAHFSYSLPEGSIWALIPFSVAIIQDGTLVANQELSMEVKGNEITDNLTIIERKGTFQEIDNEQVLIKVKAFSFEDEILKLALMTNESSSSSLIFPDIQISEDFISFKLRKEEFSDNMTGLFYNPMETNFFKSVNIQLTEIYQFQTDTTSNRAPSFLLITIIGVMCLITVLHKKYRK